MVDLGLVQRNDYYTGVVFSAYVEEWGDAVLLGGRYDNLLSRFDAPMPAVGFSVNVDAVAQAMVKRGQGAAGTQAGCVGPMGKQARNWLLCNTPLSSGSRRALSVKTPCAIPWRKQSPGQSQGHSPGGHCGRKRDCERRRCPMKPLRIALTKGRLEKDTVALLEKMGIDCTSVHHKGRQLILPIGDGQIEVVPGQGRRCDYLCGARRVRFGRGG